MLRSRDKIGTGQRRIAATVTAQPSQGVVKSEKRGAAAGPRPFPGDEFYRVKHFLRAVPRVRNAACFLGHHRRSRSLRPGSRPATRSRISIPPLKSVVLALVRRVVAPRAPPPRAPPRRPTSPTSLRRRADRTRRDQSAKKRRRGRTRATRRRPDPPRRLPRAGQIRRRPAPRPPKSAQLLPIAAAPHPPRRAKFTA